MCGRQAPFNAASVADDTIASIDAYIRRRGGDLSLTAVGTLSVDRSERRSEALTAQHQPRHSVLELVKVAARRAQLPTKRQRCATSSRVATRAALDNSDRFLSNARAMVTTLTIPETSAIAWRGAEWSALAAKGRPRLIQ